MELVVAGAFASEADAQMAKGALESAGIEAMIQSDSVGGMRPHVAWASGGYKVLVREEDAEEALKVLRPGEDVLDEER